MASGGLKGWLFQWIIPLTLALPCLTQELQPRRWSHLPTGTHFAGVGYAYTTGDINFIGKVIHLAQRYNPDRVVLSGDDSITLPLIALGGAGVISVAANIIPVEMKNLVQKALNLDIVSARNIHHQFLDLFSTLFIETNPVPVKHALEKMGYGSGRVRLPLCRLSSAW